MATFLATADMSAGIFRVIKESRRRVTLISPYLKINNLLIQELNLASARHVEIRLVYGKDELRAEERQKLEALRRVKLYFLENLHAKCYANEQLVIIGSLNLHEFSERNNREMGVLLTDEDSDAIAKARTEIESIVASAELERRQGGLRTALRNLVVRPDPFARSTPAPSPRRPTNEAVGSCIRCGVGIRYSPRTPLCDECYRVWASWGNEDFPEQRCHGCGERDDVTKARPLCRECYRADPFTSNFR